MNILFRLDVVSRYFSAPQQLDPKSKTVIGHAHLVIQRISALDTTLPADPTQFVFFKGKIIDLSYLVNLSDRKRLVLGVRDSDE